MTTETAREARPRIEAIDWLRGVLACCVMLYHVTSWAHLALPVPAERFLFRSGIYAVLSFYVISGISFGFVYRAMRLDAQDLLEFWIKRFFRIAPLYWFAMLGVLGLAAIKTFGHGAPFSTSATALLLNATITFGVIDPASYMVTGGWSIGNEMAYYVALPFLVAAARHRRWSILPLLAVSVAMGAPFAFVWIDASRPLSEQWTTYIHPLCHRFYFVAGVALSVALPPGRLPAITAGVGLALLLIVYTLGPGGGDQATIVTNGAWVYYSVLCILACAVVYAAKVHLPALPSRAMSWLGRSSYAIYLLHPLVYKTLAVLDIQRPGLRVAASVSITLALSHLVYHRIERPMIDAGRRNAPRFATWIRARPRAVMGRFGG